MLKVINPFYAKILGHRPMTKCIVALYLFIILLRYAGRYISVEVKVNGNISRPPHTLITVDAVSGLVATVEIPSGDWLIDARVRKYNENRESCVRLDASSNMTFSRA